LNSRKFAATLGAYIRMIIQRACIADARSCPSGPISGVAVAYGGKLAVRHTVTKMRMRTFGEEEVEAYARLGEGIGKAGGYAIQGRAAVFVEWFRDDYTNVVGQPLALTVRMLEGFGIYWY
jgi:septum formation protein